MTKHKHSSDHYEIYDYPSTEPVKCKQFGCGKTLSPKEQLYGQYCYGHSAKQVDWQKTFEAYQKRKNFRDRINSFIKKT